jgi:hypothetical protein
VLVERQPAGAANPITVQHAEWVLKQAQHLKECKKIRQQEEAALPVPDFEACYEALPAVQLLPDGFDSSSGDVKERAERLLEAVLPREVPQELLDAAVAQAQQQFEANDTKKKHTKQGTAPELSLEQLEQAAVEAVQQAYEAAWQQQQEVIQENLTLQEEQGLGEVREHGLCGGVVVVLTWPCCCQGGGCGCDECGVVVWGRRWWSRTWHYWRSWSWGR